MVRCEGFASLHGIGVKRVGRVAQLTAHGTTPNDKRGKHRKQDTESDDIRLKIDDHISNFPYQVSHYGGHRSKRRYLSADLNVLRMYTMFSANTTQNIMPSSRQVKIHKSCSVKSSVDTILTISKKNLTLALADRKQIFAPFVLNWRQA